MVDFQMIVADFEKQKKMLVGYHHLKLVIVVAVESVVFLDYQFVYHVLGVYNIHPRRRSKLHTDRVKSKTRRKKIQDFQTNPPPL